MSWAQVVMQVEEIVQQMVQVQEMVVGYKHPGHCGSHYVKNYTALRCIGVCLYWRSLGVCTSSLVAHR